MSKMNLNIYLCAFWLMTLTMQRLTTNFIKERLPKVKHMEYYSDGCAGQYKNFKNLMNLRYHESDFGIDAIWSFFATSHRKSPCDEIGGIVEMKIARTSLHRPVTNQILSFDASSAKRISRQSHISPSTRNIWFKLERCWNQGIS